MKEPTNADTMEPKKKQRKPRKASQKELLNMYYDELGIEKEPKEKEKEKTYIKKADIENFQYISAKEKTLFENKFTIPKNRHQEQYVSMLKQKSKKIIVVSGPAGTGKTLFATEYGVKNFLLGNYDKLIFTRPSVSVDEELGFLPGSLEEKMAPWVRPIYDVLYNFVTPSEVNAMMEEKIIEIAPLGYMRGRTFKNAWIVADEMQNSTVSQMKMLLTRLGENSRLVITGDLEQYDKISELNGLEDFLQKFKGKRSASITSFEFQRGDIQREEVVKEVLDIYSAEHTLNYLPSQEEINEDLQYSENNIDNKSTTTEDKSEEKENSEKDDEI
jgi:phosphate starvation-inducible PhoH-like protein